MQRLKPALQYSAGRSYTWSGAVLTNAYAEVSDGDKREAFAVLATPGLTLWTTLPGGVYRGSVICAGVLYVVSGGFLYSVDSAGSYTQLGVIPGTGPVSMAANYTEVAIAANGTGYVWSGGALYTPVPFDVSSVVYFDSYMVWQIKDSEQFIISSLDDALTYDAADVASVEGSPDNIVGMVNSHRELQFFGADTIEIFYNSGAVDFPFERQGNSFIERGCFDRDSIVKINNAVMFVGDDRIVYSLNGYSPQRVSTHWVEYLLRDATYARAWTYDQEGHKFYVLECDRGTILFDIATGAWHKRASYGSDFWRCNGGIVAYNQTILGDRDNGNLYIPSPDVHTENGDPIIVQVDLPPIEANRERMTMYSFEIVMDTGLGNGDVADPQAMLQYSDDNGHRWSNEMWRSLGLVGEYRTRAVWRKLGQFRQRQMRIRISDPVSRFLVSYWADIQ